jgi:hypothetical protein
MRQHPHGIDLAARIEGLSTKQITLLITANGSADTPDKQALELFRRRVGSMLRRQLAKGLILLFAGPNRRFMLWEMLGTTKF